MRIWLAALVVAGLLLPASLQAALPSADKPILRECVTEQQAVDALTEQGATLAGYVQGAVAHQLISKFPPLPQGLAINDFKAVQIWALSRDVALVVLFDNEGCVRLTGQMPLAVALNVLAQVQRDA